MIGRSEGAKVSFNVEDTDNKIDVFTTRPDTIFGTSFLVLSPEHSLVNSITSEDKQEEVKAYQEEASKKSDLERTDLAKGKQAFSQVHMQLILFLVRNYQFGLLIMYYQHMELVQLWRFLDMMNVIMNLQRNLIYQSLSVKGGDVQLEAYTGEGEHVNSGELNGLENEAAISKSN